MSYESDHCRFEREQAKKLVGGKVTSVIFSTDRESFGLSVKKANKTYNVWVDCDPEGNGPGHLNIEGVQER